MRFADIPGLKETKDRLIRSVKDGKVAHAQLFMGREGALNLPLAIAYATYLHCQQRGESDACGTCPACAKNLKYIHPDTHFVFPLSNIKGDKDEDRFRADIMKSWRSFLLENPFGQAGDWTLHYGGEDKMAIISKEESREIVKALSLKPFESPFKVMIIWQPEAMHPSAANGILKILEEPPANTFFILVSNNAERLLPTIISRTQQIVVPLLFDDDVISYLMGTEGADREKVVRVAAEADGNLRLAAELMTLEETDHHSQMAEWLRSCYKKDFPRLVSFAEEFHDFDRLQQQTFLQYTLHMLRETLLAQAGAEELLRSRGNEQKFIRDFSKVMTVSRIEKTQSLLTEASGNLERNGSAKMIFLHTSIQVSQLLNS